MGDIQGDVAIAVVRCNSEYLLVRRSAETSSSGKWAFPGGRIESGETPEEAACRELQEETGLDGDIVRSGDTYLNDGELGTWRIHPFLVEVDSREVLLCHEHDDYHWIALDQLEDFDTLGELQAPKKLGL